MKKETLEQDIKNATNQLLELARESCWNIVSSNCLYFLTEIEDFKGKDFIELRVERKKINQKKTPKSIDQITSDLENLYSNLYDINLHVYHALKGRTIIEIRYYPKSSLDKDFLQKVKDSEPMLHYKIPIPPYAYDSKEQFDINWELGGLRHFWKMMWWKRKAKMKVEKVKTLGNIVQ